MYKTCIYMAQVVDVRGQDFSEEVQRVYWAITIGRMLFSKHDVFEYGIPGTADYISVALKDIVTCFSMCCGLAKTGQSEPPFCIVPLLRHRRCKMLCCVTLTLVTHLSQIRHSTSDSNLVSLGSWFPC